MTDKNNSNNSGNNTSRPSSNDSFGVFRQNLDKMFNGIRQSVPQYHQAITNVQQEYLQACENVANSAFEFQREVARKSGLSTGIPEAAVRTIGGTTEEIAKIASINNQVILTTIDATQQNIKTFNDNAKSFSSINHDILKSWISAFRFRAN
ncbi:MAG: hypothetical protein OXK17_08810 [Thaumarchaeota archaeon]|nr:hypothetical protein [Nitrososphaerota archaeon]